MNLTARQKIWFEKMRTEWFEVMRPFDHPRSYPFFTPVPRLEYSQIQNARLVPDREYLLEHCLPKAGIVAEVGTQAGLFAKKILDISRPIELHLIDLDFSLLTANKIVLPCNNVKFHEGNSWTIMSQFPDKYFDWIYIDADHSYEGCRNDIAVGKFKIKESGLLVFNDYTYWSPVECTPYGVVQAVNELIINDDFEIMYMAFHPLFYNDVVLRKRGVE